MKMIICGKEVDASDQTTINIVNPYTGQVIDTVPNATEKEEDKEIELDKDIEKRGDCQQVVDLFHSICKSFPKIRSLSQARKKAIKARLNTYSLDDFKAVFENAEASSFLKGSNARNWTATFDWLIKDSNMAKVLEGNYADKGKRKEKVPGWMEYRQGSAEQSALSGILGDDFEDKAAEAMKRIQEVTG